MNVRRYLLLGLVAVILAFPLALWALGVLAPPVCRPSLYCLTADPWVGHYVVVALPGGKGGIPGDAWVYMPTPPSFPLLWVSATAAVWVVLWAVGWLMRRPGGRVRSLTGARPQ
jgi:hypothetical protein